MVITFTNVLSIVTKKHTTNVWYYICVPLNPTQHIAPRLNLGHDDDIARGDVPFPISANHWQRLVANCSPGKHELLVCMVTVNMYCTEKSTTVITIRLEFRRCLLRLV